MEERSQRTRLQAIALSLTLSVLLMAVKFYIYFLTRSAAVLSDALESIVNVIASSFALWSIYLAAKPPDSEHPYGHGKVEYFSAGFEGALIVVAALGIFWSAWHQIRRPHPLPNLDLGLWLVLATSIVNGALGGFLVTMGKRTHSLALVADGKHILTDAFSSAAVVLGLVLVKFTGWHWIDGVVAALIGAHILFSGRSLLKESFAGLMDASDPALLREISELLAQHRKTIWIDIHRLRAWRSGRHLYVDFHLILPRYLPLIDAHREVAELEELFRVHFQGSVEVFVHVDPCQDPDCPICSVPQCAKRSHPKSVSTFWSQSHLTTRQ
ncbi:cation diffusion facilitator family transporter [Desulfosoma caldarium]|uniref:Cation diffusion facilitator family transporter n=1 Tax=Desulfosoma caldarium TaxID=610254 RepID=A0A3N1UQD9_9BACT|nr:cation diffusion facilitator family transporter [Desulfosoma caldarium]ROQ93335.1 cation diffusion facilitator family transporter [Desulfosoma caldarium]